MKFIISGFGPFGSIVDNPSRTVAKEVVDELVRRGIDATFLDFRVAMSEVDNFYANLAGGDLFVIHIGVFAGITKMHLESQAFNNADFSIPDDDGKQPKNTKIDENYPLDYELKNKLPVSEWVQVLPQYFDLSYDPGRFVCNYTYFRAMENVNVKTKGTIFVHVAEFKDFNKEFQVSGVTKLAHLIDSHFK